MQAHYNMSCPPSPAEEARRLFLSRFSALCTGEEKIPVRECVGRVTAAVIHARFSSPSFHAAAMDGLAVQAEKTANARENAPLHLNLARGDAVLINTGEPLPPESNAVVKIEHVILNADKNLATLHSPVRPWQHVRKGGEDIVATELLFPGGQRIRPADLIVLITGGCSMVPVRRQARVCVVPYGTDLMWLEDCTKGLPPGKAIEANALAVAALVEETGAAAKVVPMVGDDYASIREQVQSRLPEADLLILSAGSSRSRSNILVRILEEMGEVLAHGIAIMPGKSTVLATVDGKPVIGLSGYPVSAMIAMEQFVLPLLAKMQGINLPEEQYVQARLAHDLPSTIGVEEFHRVALGRIGDYFLAVPLKKGAGIITSLTRANGMLHSSTSSEGERQGKLVRVQLLTPLGLVERTILCVGSHDLCLELIKDLLSRRNPAYQLSSSHVGSMGGIMALKQLLCHVAGSHLLDQTDGSYNTSFVREHLPGRDIRLVTLVHREQGFMVPRGNPKRIRGVADLADGTLQFINRQAGSGTRVLLDYELGRNRLDPAAIKGYDDEEFTHMAVAAAVLSGKADAGLGIHSAARALGLDFLPLVEERYDLLIPGELFETGMMQALMEVIVSRAFLEAVASLGGYSTRETGRLIPLR